jgi:tetratricopeptide (TPR) repeat protein
LPAEQWPLFKKELTAQAYDSLGLAAALDKKFPEAITSYKSAIEANPESPVATARLAKAYVDNKQYDDAITTADKVLAMNEAPPAVKQFAQQQKEAATKLKTPTPAK